MRGGRLREVVAKGGSTVLLISNHMIFLVQFGIKKHL